MCELARYGILPANSGPREEILLFACCRALFTALLPSEEEPSFLLYRRSFEEGLQKVIVAFALGILSHIVPVFVTLRTLKLLGSGPWLLCAYPTKGKISVGVIFLLPICIFLTLLPARARSLAWLELGICRGITQHGYR
jgi:hypothetical protein